MDMTASEKGPKLRAKASEPPWALKFSHKERSPRRRVKVLVRVITPTSMFRLTSNCSEQASGPHGLARVKDYDRRFAFYPSFSVERSLVLDFRADKISQLSTEIQHLRDGLKHGIASRSLDAVRIGSVKEKLETLMWTLTESLAQYGGQLFRQ